jgi:hypothetical protein
MARPITWQDVAAPRGLAVGIEVFGRGGDRLAQAVQGMGQVAVDYREDRIKEATDAAVAGIANSQDPTAAAAALPKDWTIDPLAVAVAANARSGQLLDTRVKESNLAENEAQISNMKSIQEDRESARLIATKVQQYEPLARAGKEFELDQEDPFWQTAAGFEGLQYLNGLRDTAFNQDQERKRTAAAQVQARAASEALRLANAERQARNLMANWMQSDEGSASTVAEQQRKGREFGQATGAGEAFGTTLPGQFQGARGLATDEELKRRAPNGVTYEASINALLEDSARAEGEKAVALRDLEQAAAGARAMGQNTYKNYSGEAINQAVLKNNKDMAEGKGWFTLAKDSEDVQDARDKQRNLAKAEAATVARENNLPLPNNKFIPLLPEQEANLAELVLNGNSSAAAELRRQYLAYNLVGAEPGLEVITKQRSAPYDTRISKNQKEIQRTEGAAIGYKPVPTTALDAYKRTPDGQLWDQTREKPWDFVDRSLQNNRNQR